MATFFKAPPRVPTRAEVDACLRVTDTDDRARDHLLIAMAAGTGLRVHELVALDWEQVITDTGTVRHRVRLAAEHTKGAVGGEVVLHEKLRWKLSRYRTWSQRRGLPTGGAAPLFSSRNHRRISVRMVQEIWRNLQKLAAVERPFHFHALRHHFGTELYRSSRDLRVTQVAMRHQSVSSTQIYTHVSERDVEAAIERLG